MGETIPLVFVRNSRSGEPLIRVRGKSSPCRILLLQRCVGKVFPCSIPIVCGEAGRRVVMWSPCAGAALDPPLWTIVPNIFSLSLPSSASLKMSPSGASDLRSLVALPPASDTYDRGVVSRCHCYLHSVQLWNLQALCLRIFAPRP